MTSLPSTGATAPPALTLPEVLAVLLDPGQVAELRILHAGLRRATYCGYFDDWGRMAAAAAGWSGKASAVYWTLNPVLPALLARYTNRLQQLGRDQPSTTDKEILRRRWLLVDTDFQRPAGISATDDERRAAHRLARRIRTHLADAGWPAPLYADSGNGAHLLYRIDLPNDDAARDLVSRVLVALALLWDEAVPGVKVDTTNFNAARICKLYGTLSMKGDATPDRPHRVARLLDVPDAPRVVERALLEALAAHAPTDTGERARAFAGAPGAPFDVESFIRANGLQVARQGTWGDGGQRWVLSVCPWDPAHTDDSAYILQFRSGAVAAGCHHNGCQGRHWADLRALFDTPRPLAPARTARPVASAPAALAPGAPVSVDLAATPPFAKWEALRAAQPRAAQTWSRTRRDLRSQTPATYSLALARLAADAGWPAQEIADLLAAFHTFHRDPEPPDGWAAVLARTVAKAQEATAAASEDLDPPADGGPETAAAKLARLSARLGVAIHRVVRHPVAGDRPLYYVETARGSTKPDTAECLMDNRAFRLRLYEATGHLCPLLKRGGWDPLAQLLADVAEDVELGPEASPLGALRGWLAAYLADSPPADEQIELAIRNHGPFRKGDSTYLFLDGFVEWLWVKRRVQLDRRHLAQALRTTGALPGAVNYRKEDGTWSTCHAYRVPDLAEPAGTPEAAAPNPGG